MISIGWKRPANGSTRLVRRVADVCFYLAASSESSRDPNTGGWGWSVTTYELCSGSTGIRGAWGWCIGTQAPSTSHPSSGMHCSPTPVNKTYSSWTLITFCPAEEEEEKAEKEEEVTGDMPVYLSKRLWTAGKRRERESSRMCRCCVNFQFLAFWAQKYGILWAGSTKYP